MQIQFLALLGTGAYLLFREYGVARTAAAVVAPGVPVTGFTLFYEATGWPASSSPGAVSARSRRWSSSRWSAPSREETAMLAKHTITELTVLVKTRMRQMQYRPADAVPPGAAGRLPRQYRS